jgi:cytoskeletal protein CcmA (bactofilin family)
MIYEYTYNNNKICNGCKYLKFEKGSIFEGECICKDNKIKNRKRNTTDKKCKFKISKI